MRDSVEENADWIAALASKAIPGATLDKYAPFFNGQGREDVDAVLTPAMQRQRNMSLPPGTVRRNPTPYLLAQWMSGHADDIYDPVFDFHRPGDDTASNLLICVHPVTGVGKVFSGLAKRLSPDFRTCGLQARGLNPAETPFASLEEMVSCYTDRVAEIIDDRPPIFLGWSFGGQIARSVAIELQRRGYPTGMVFLIDSPISHDVMADRPAPLMMFEDYLRQKYGQVAPDLLDAFDAMDNRQRIERIIDPLIEIEAFSASAALMPFPAIERAVIVAFHLENMFLNARPQATSDATILLRANDNALWGFDVAQQWPRFSSNLVVEDVPYPHMSIMINDESIDAVAAIVRRHCGET